MSDDYFKRLQRRVNGYPKWARIVVGALLLLGGTFGFLPVIGFWMIPLGLLVLSYDLPFVRRWRRRAEVTLLRRWRHWRSRHSGS